VYTGATAIGSCALCQAGTYQTGSGQLQKRLMHHIIPDSPILGHTPRQECSKRMGPLRSGGRKKGRNIYTQTCGGRQGGLFECTTSAEIMMFENAVECHRKRMRRKSSRQSAVFEV
jgi:hypothetical protein